MTSIHTCSESTAHQIDVTDGGLPGCNLASSSRRCYISPSTFHVPKMIACLAAVSARCQTGGCRRLILEEQSYQRDTKLRLQMLRMCGAVSPRLLHFICVLLGHINMYCLTNRTHLRQRRKPEIYFVLTLSKRGSRRIT
jgi:hypothetical protein